MFSNRTTTHPATDAFFYLWLQNGKHLVENNITGSVKGLFRSAEMYQINLNLKLGALTDLNIWNHTISYNDMVTWTTCKWVSYCCNHPHYITALWFISSQTIYIWKQFELDNFRMDFKNDGIQGEYTRRGLQEAYTFWCTYARAE